MGKLIFDDNSPDTVLRIKATSISLLDVKNSRKVTNDVSADAIWAIQVGKNLSANSILAPTSPVSTITVGGDLTLTKKLDISSADLIKVAGNMEADVRLDEGYNTTINVGKDFTGDVLSQGSIGGGLGEMKVGGNFSGPGPGAPVKMLLRAKDVIGSVIVTGNIQSDGGIEGGSIGLIESTQFSILVPTIKSTNGDIYAVLAKQGKIEAAIIANKGNISTVDAETVAGSITAKADPDQAKDVVFSRTNAGANVLPISGSISYVHSHKLIPQRVRIQADWWVGQVIVDAGMNDVEKCSVLGQAGNYSLNAGGTDYVFSPIVINVGAGKYLGTVTMTSQTKYPLPDWQNGDPLLTVKSQTNQTVSWQIKGPPNGLTTILALVFGDVKGIFGIVNKKFQGTQFDTDPPK